MCCTSSAELLWTCGQQPLNAPLPMLIPVNMSVPGLREEQGRGKDDVTPIYKQNPLIVFPGTGYPAANWVFNLLESENSEKLLRGWTYFTCQHPSVPSELRGFGFNVIYLCISPQNASLSSGVSPFLDSWTHFAVLNLLKKIPKRHIRTVECRGHDCKDGVYTLFFPQNMKSHKAHPCDQARTSPKSGNAPWGLSDRVWGSPRPHSPSAALGTQAATASSLLQGPGTARMTWTS